MRKDRSDCRRTLSARHVLQEIVDHGGRGQRQIGQRRFPELGSRSSYLPAGGPTGLMSCGRRSATCRTTHLCTPSFSSSEPARVRMTQADIRNARLRAPATVSSPPGWASVGVAELRPHRLGHHPYDLEVVRPDLVAKSPIVRRTHFATSYESPTTGVSPKGSVTAVWRHVAVRPDEIGGVRGGPGSGGWDGPVDERCEQFGHRDVQGGGQFSLFSSPMVFSRHSMI